MKKSIFLLLFLTSCILPLASSNAESAYDTSGAGTLDSIAARERQIYLEKADKGHAREAYIIAYMFETGKGTRKDLTKAKRYYQVADASGKYPGAAYRLGVLSEKREDKSAYFKKAAEKDYIPAMTAYAKTLEEKGPSLDATKWYNKACYPTENISDKSYDPAACFRLGETYEADRINEAFPYFKRAADKFYGPAYEKMGDYYAANEQFEEAFTYYQKGIATVIIGTKQQELIDKRDEASKHLTPEKMRELLEKL